MDEFNNNRNAQPPPNHGEGRKSIKPSRDEEYAAEYVSDAPTSGSKQETISMYGWIGIALSIISFFMWPLVFGAAGIILGFVSRSKGADSLGNIAIAAGAISILISLFIIPFF